MEGIYEVQISYQRQRQLTFSAQKASACEADCFESDSESFQSQCSSAYSSNKTPLSHLSPVADINNNFSHNYKGRSIFSNSTKSQLEDNEEGSGFEESQRDLKSLIEAEEELHSIWAAAPKTKVCRPKVLSRQSDLPRQQNLRISPARKSTASL